MANQPQLKLYNTLTRQKEDFIPIDENNVRMYVCGPTVYDFAHIGNARPVIVFDVLYRLLRHIHGKDKVTYVRNITDVDDKINARALRDFGDEIQAGKMTLNEAIRHVTEKTANQFHADVKALGCLEPDVEPRATEFVLARADGKADMVSLIQSLLDKGHAYIAKGKEGREVLFDVTSMKDYGALSNRKLDEQQAGARIAVESHKKNPGDFVLWKESDQDQPGWNGSFKSNGDENAIHGRPGWHIECSAMSAAYLGETFDIHGGGLDLIFPHHENEIAQSCCANGTKRMANIWMHNGYLQVEGKKMSKSEGNFVTIHELLETDKFGGRKWPGEVLRLAMLMTHYREPIDFSVKRLEEAQSVSYNWKDIWGVMDIDDCVPRLNREFLAYILDDLDTAGAVNFLGEKYNKNYFELEERQELYGALLILGIVPDVQSVAKSVGEIIFQHRKAIEQLTKHDWQSAFSAMGNAIRGYNRSINMLPQLTKEFNSTIQKMGANTRKLSESLSNGVKYSDKGMTVNNLIKVEANIPLDQLNKLIENRLAFIADKNWAEADRIRDELLAQGIQLKDSKDSETGERITTWEVKR